MNTFLAVALLVTSLITAQGASAQACAEILPPLVMAPNEMTAELPDRAVVSDYEVAVFRDGASVASAPVSRVTVAASAWTPTSARDCYTAPVPVALQSMADGHYRASIRAVRAGAPDWSDLSNLFAYVPDPQGPPPPTVTASPDCTTAATVIDAQLAVWTIDPVTGGTLRDGKQMANGRAVEYRVKGGDVYARNAANAWYRWTGTAWPSVLAPSCAAPPPPPPPPVVTQVLKHFRIVVDGATYDGDLPKVP